jgi:hypothetical protein
MKSLFLLVLASGIGCNVVAMEKTRPSAQPENPLADITIQNAIEYEKEYKKWKQASDEYQAARASGNAQRIAQANARVGALSKSLDEMLRRPNFISLFELLKKAAVRDDVTLAKLLIGTGYIDFSQPGYVELLPLAARNKSINVMRYLLGLGKLNVNAADYRRIGKSAMQIAKQDGNKEMIALLKGNGATE